MQYLLTQEEFDKLGGNREAMRKEFQAKMDAKIAEFSKSIDQFLRPLRSANPLEWVRPNPQVDALVTAVRTAMKKCELEPEPDQVPSVPQRG
jgi:hypothetical protein